VPTALLQWVIRRSDAEIVLQFGESAIAVAKASQTDSHAIHQCKVQTAGAAVFIASIKVVQHPACLQRTPTTTGEHNWHLIGLMFVSVEQVRTEH
jgi:hypothetical protein